ncbi:MAG: RraA family protein [Parvibaculaceae bacterium]
MNDISVEEMSRRLGAVYTGALTDILFDMGRGAQTLPHAIKPVVTGDRISAPAFTAEWAPYLSGGKSKAWDMLKSVPPGHALIAATNIRERASLGDLALAFLAARGCKGLVLDGGCRDIDIGTRIGLPRFCAFTTPQDASHGRGEVRRWGHEITIGEVRIRTGDFIVADTDGVVIIPKEIAKEVLVRAEALVKEETRIREALLAGASPDDLFPAD